MLRKLFKIGNKGQSMVEFALILPVFLLMLFGLIEWGMFFSKQHQLNQFTKEITRIASIEKDNSSLKTQIEDKWTETEKFLGGGTLDPPISPPASFSPPPRTKGQSFKFKFKYEDTYEPFTLFIPDFIESSYETLAEVTSE
jgi:Flp pilus assembly protein TadG